MIEGEDIKKICGSHCVFKDILATVFVWWKMRLQVLSRDYLYAALGIQLFELNLMITEESQHAN